MITFLILMLLLVIYVISIIIVIIRYTDKSIEISFWACVFLLTPILNTYIAFKISPNFKQFWNQLKE